MLNRRRRRQLRLVGHLCIAVLPSRLKILVYRHLLGYEIGDNVRIGFSVIEARECSIADGTTIGHGNALLRIERLELGDHVRIGHLNVIRGGTKVVLGRYAELLRLNEINAIPESHAVTPHDSELHIGPGAVITTGHKIDFTDRVELGRRSIIGGRNSSLWTHNRQRTLPISVGELSYVGSDCRMSPGASVPARSVIGMGAVVAGQLSGEGWMFAGVPAKAIKALSEEDLSLVERKTREDLPDDL